MIHPGRFGLEVQHPGEALERRRTELLKVGVFCRQERAILLQLFDEICLSKGELFYIATSVRQVGLGLSELLGEEPAFFLGFGE